jgi:hypothetical protein
VFKRELIKQSRRLAELAVVEQEKNALRIEAFRRELHEQIEQEERQRDRGSWRRKGGNSSSDRY